MGSRSDSDLILRDVQEVGGALGGFVDLCPDYSNVESGSLKQAVELVILSS